jgi:hypothetical protein
MHIAKSLSVLIAFSSLAACAATPGTEADETSSSSSAVESPAKATVKFPLAGKYKVDAACLWFTPGHVYSVTSNASYVAVNEEVDVGGGETGLEEISGALDVGLQTGPCMCVGGFETDGVYSHDNDVFTYRELESSGQGTGFSLDQEWLFSTTAKGISLDVFPPKTVCTFTRVP